MKFHPRSTSATLSQSAILAVLATSVSSPADTVQAWIDRVRNPDDSVRGAAWPQAASYGADAVPALAQVMSDPDYETARAAKRALWLIVRHAGRPGAHAEKQKVQDQLIALLPHPATVVRREAVWMLSEIGDSQAVSALAPLLNDPSVREDARCALVRIAGSKTRRALRQALTSGLEDFKPALAEALRQLGESVPQYPSRKLVPTKQTSVQPLAASPQLNDILSK
jgi:HEAT repeat protein